MVVYCQTCSCEFLGLLRQFHAIQNRRHGYCYASKYFAVGEFDAAGGLLHLKDSEPAELYIPPGKVIAFRRGCFIKQLDRYQFYQIM